MRQAATTRYIEGPNSKYDRSASTEIAVRTRKAASKWERSIILNTSGEGTFLMPARAPAHAAGPIVRRPAR